MLPVACFVVRKSVGRLDLPGALAPWTLAFRFSSSSVDPLGCNASALGAFLSW